MKTLKSLLSLALASLIVAFALPGVASADIASGVVRKKVAGIDVIVYRTGVEDVVTVAGSLPAGDAFADAGNIAVPTLVSMMLDKGTTKHDQFQISAMLEKVGAGLSFGEDNEQATVGARCLKKDLQTVIDLMAEQLRMPAFKAEELEKAKAQFIGGTRQALEDTGSMANEAFARAVYQEGHPNRPHSAQEFIDAAPKVTVADLQAFHKKYYGPAGMTLVFVGDVNAQQIQGLIAKAFGGWSGGVADVLRAKAPATPLTAARDIPVPMPGKTSVTVIMGQASGISYRDPDAMPLRMATAIFGSGFTGRLMGTVRDREGLTYGIGANVGNDTFNDGVWTISATFAPELMDKGITSTRRELMKWWKDGITAQELAARKTNIIGSYQVGLSTTGGLAGTLLRAANLGYDMSWVDQYPKKVEALTLEQVNAAIRKHLDPEKMVLVKAGTLKQ